MVDRLDSRAIRATEVIQWSCPVPSFGDPSHSRIATVGINPSNREFVDESGNELLGIYRRFHTLRSLGLASWSAADARHLSLVLETCRLYFTVNPYNNWFRRLEFVLSGSRASYYDSPATACHVDLVPYATVRKWSELPTHERSLLMDVAEDTLGLILHKSPVRVLILNGSAVVKRFESIVDFQLEPEIMPGWSLKRKSQRDVLGMLFRGEVNRLAGIRLARPVKVIGFNHNLQGSFGVSTNILNGIRDWMDRNVRSELW